MADSKFDTLLSEKERAAWNSFKIVVKNFLGNNKSENYKAIVTDLFKKISTNGSKHVIKDPFPAFSLRFFPENLGSMSDEQGERFHQDLKTFEDRHQGYWDENMLGDYCWSILRETDQNTYKKKSKICHFYFISVFHSCFSHFFTILNISKS